MSIFRQMFALSHFNRLKIHLSDQLCTLVMISADPKPIMITPHIEAEYFLKVHLQFLSLLPPWEDSGALSIRNDLTLSEVYFDIINTLTIWWYFLPFFDDVFDYFLTIFWMFDFLQDYLEVLDTFQSCFNSDSFGIEGSLHP